MLKKAQYYLIVGVLYGISLLPLSVLYIISDILAFLLRTVIGYRIQTVKDNLSYSFPEKTQKERDRILTLYYSHLADLLVEGIKMFTMDEKTLRKHFKSPFDSNYLGSQNQEALTVILESKGCIGMLGHYGNWEWASFVSSLNFPTKKNWIIFKPLSDSNFNTLINQVRSRFGAELVEMKMVLRKFAGETKDPFLAYFVSDQSPMTLSSHHKITFLNQETLVYLGAEKIAKAKNLPVIYVEIHKIKRGVYTTLVEVISKNSAELSTEEINIRFQRRLEKTIQEKPEYWLWSHKRWKYTRNVKPETSPFPTINE